MRTILAFETSPGEGFGLMRHALIRAVLLVQHAVDDLASDGQGAGQHELCLALPPISATPHVAPDRHPADGLRWSRVIDLDRLQAGTGIEAVDLDDVVAGRPGLPWHQLNLTLGTLPADGEEHWRHEDPTERSTARPNVRVARAKPAGWLSPKSVEWIDTFSSPTSPYLAQEVLALPDGEDHGLFLAGLERISWGRSYGSAEFWRVVASLGPAPSIAQLAADLRPDTPYLGVHWRRGDFASAHPEVTPGPTVAAAQVDRFATAHDLATVFLATDAGPQEVDDLRAEIASPHLRVETLPADPGVPLGDLERSLVEQAILFDSTCFVGTRYSTFSAAVHETREATGRWAPAATWNVLTGDADHPTPRRPDLGHGLHRWARHTD